MCSELSFLDLEKLYSFIIAVNDIVQDAENRCKHFYARCIRNCHLRMH